MDCFGSGSFVRLQTGWQSGLQSFQNSWGWRVHIQDHACGFWWASVPYHAGPSIGWLDTAAAFPWSEWSETEWWLKVEATVFNGLISDAWCLHLYHILLSHRPTLVQCGRALYKSDYQETGIIGTTLEVGSHNLQGNNMKQVFYQWGNRGTEMLLDKIWTESLCSKPLHEAVSPSGGMEVKEERRQMCLNFLVVKKRMS